MPILEVNKLCFTDSEEDTVVSVASEDEDTESDLSVCQSDLLISALHPGRKRPRSNHSPSRPAGKVACPAPLGNAATHAAGAEASNGANVINDTPT